MPSDGRLRFEALTPEHYNMLRRWLNEPHWRQWWGDPEAEFGYIRDMVEGRDATWPFVFFVDDEPAGYVQYWFIGPHQTEPWAKDNPWLMELPGDAVGIDLSIGSADKLSQGIGSLVLRAFVERLRNKGYTTIVIDPDPQNHRAVRAYEKAGFVPVAHLVGRTDGVLIMQHQLISNEKSS